MVVSARPLPLTILLVAVAAAVVWVVLAARSSRSSRIELARSLHASGRFEEARDVLAPLAADGAASLEVLRGMAELEYLLGHYPAAETLLGCVVERSGAAVQARVEAEAALALVHYQTGAYERARSLFDGFEDAIDLPIWQLMRQMGGTAYRIDWAGDDQAELPFLQTADHELPRVAVGVAGREMEATIDTGGDLFSIPWATAGLLGIEPVATFDGTFAGGTTACQGYAVLDELRLGAVTLTDVPIMINTQDTAVIGTGLLSRFLPTLDYPAGRLVLRPRGSSLEAEGVEIPFVLALTHLMVAEGSLDDASPLMFMVDSGLVDERGASFIAPASTLELAGIPTPPTEPVEGLTGAGTATLEVGRFPIARLGMGPLTLEHTEGLYGVFPPDLAGAATGFTIHGSISHHFLRRYSWTIDFDRMAFRMAG